MAIHNKNNFLVPVASDDVEVFTRDVNRVSTNSISPRSVVFLQARGVNIELKTKGTDNLVLIPFSTNKEAIEALTLLKTAMKLVEDNMAPQPTGPTFYHHIQITASNVWTFSHNLGKMTAVSILDNNFNEIVGQVDYLDVNRVSIYFNQALNGHAWI